MKKKIVEVDEDVLKDIIVGDIPVFGNHRRRHTCFRQGQPRPERKVRGTSGSEKPCRNRTGRYSSGKARRGEARRGEAQKEKG